MNLLLLTGYFPYYPGEQFLEGEIPLLAKHFKKITIFPLNLNVFADNGSPRPVPENVEVLLLPQDLSKQYKTCMILKTAGLLCHLRNLVTATIDGRIFQPPKLHKTFAQYFIASLSAFLIFQKVNLEMYDIIYSYWGAEKGLILHFLKKKCSKKTAFVSRVHGYDLYAEREGLRRLPFQKHLLNACDLVAPVSAHGETYLKNRYGQRAKNVRHFHLGVPVQNIVNKGSVDDTLRIVTCSNIVPVKRLELLISALMGVSRKVVWTHIGDGPDKGKILKSLKQLPPNVQSVFVGHLANDEVIDYYRNNPVDLFINISSYEGVPVSVMEALSFGIEPIVTEVGGEPELVKPEFGTLLNVDFQPEELSNILETHQNSQSRRIKAQEHQQKYFSLSNYQSFASELLVIYRKKNGEG